MVIKTTTTTTKQTKQPTWKAVFLYSKMHQIDHITLIIIRCAELIDKKRGWNRKIGNRVPIY
jgi:hypothetical protein